VIADIFLMLQLKIRRPVETVCLLFLLLWTWRARAAGAQCLVGSQRKTEIHDLLQIQNHDHGLIEAYQESRLQGPRRELASSNEASAAVDSNTNKESRCPVKSALQDAQKNSLRILQNVPLPGVKRECFVISMKRRHGSEEFYCPSSSLRGRETLGVPGDSGQCLTNDVIDYTRWAFHEAVNCMSDPARPIDPLTLFLLINNESAFHFSTANRGGVGIGQLTSAAIDAVNHPERSGTKNYLQMVKESRNPHCEPFKKALAEPLSNSYSGGYCPLLQPSEGLARSLIYSISYYLMTRDSLMTGVLHHFAKKGVERAAFYDYAALAMYGPTALAEQAHVIQAYDESKGDLRTYLSLLKKKIPYFADTLKSTGDIIRSENTNIHSLKDCLEKN
jgi:hypothetical protein